MAPRLQPGPSSHMRAVRRRRLYRSHKYQLTLPSRSIYKQGQSAWYRKIQFPERTLEDFTFDKTVAKPIPPLPSSLFYIQTQSLSLAPPTLYLTHSFNKYRCASFSFAVINMADAACGMRGRRVGGGGVAGWRGNTPVSGGWTGCSGTLAK